MKNFAVTSADLAVPEHPTDAPTRLLQIAWQGQAITGFNQSARRCYVYPVTTPAGVPLTNERSQSDHPFHQSVTVGNDYFFTYQTSAAGRFEEAGMCFYTDSPDMRGRGEGRIVATAHNECTEVGPDHLECIVRLQWQGPEEGYAPKYRRVVAEEMRTLSLYPGEGAHIIDLRSQLRPTQWDIRLGPSRHGYFTIRLADHLRVVDRQGRPLGGQLVDSEGRRGEEVGWQHADWIDYYGTDGEGRRAGLAVFQYPSLGNAAWYAGTYGSIRVNPFRKAGTFVCRGQEIDVAVRLVAHDGDPFEAGVEQYYQAFQQYLRDKPETPPPFVRPQP